MRVVVLAALPEEAGPLLGGHARPLRLGRFDAERTVLARHDVTVVVTGLGKVNAAVATTLAAQASGAELVVMTGVCGRLVPVGGHAFWLAEAVQHDYGAARDGRFERYTAGSFPIGPVALEPFLAMPDPGVGLPHARIASGDAFVEDPVPAAALAADLDAQLVDMEVAAVAQVCTRLDLPWAAVKAPTDDADGDGADDFATNLVTAAARAAAGVERLLELV